MEIDSRLLFLWFQFVISSSKNSEGRNAAQEAWATRVAIQPERRKAFFVLKTKCMYVCFHRVSLVVSLFL